MREALDKHNMTGEGWLSHLKSAEQIGRTLQSILEEALTATYLWYHNHCLRNVCFHGDNVIQSSCSLYCSHTYSSNESQKVSREFHFQLIEFKSVDTYIYISTFEILCLVCSQIILNQWWCLQFPQQ